MTVKPSIQTGRKAMALREPPLRTPLIGTRRLERRSQEKPCSRRPAAEDDWLRELFAAIPDLRDADVGRDRRAAGG